MQACIHIHAHEHTQSDSQPTIHACKMCYFLLPVPAGQQANQEHEDSSVLTDLAFSKNF